MAGVPAVFLMAAGRGTRLAPWTEVLPKPLVPVANEPVFGHLLRLLARQGFRDVTSNVSWLGDMLVDAFGDGSAYGVQLRWSREDEPLGTAGGLKRCEGHLRRDDTPVVVLSGDGLHGMDLGALVEAHRAAGAMATLGLVPVTEPTEYGVAVLDERGRIVEFQEKPALGTERSRLANSGIYVLSPAIFDLMQPGAFHDFGSELFPRMLTDGAHLQGVEMGGYWNDIGTLDELRSSSFAAVTGAVEGIEVGERDDGWGDGIVVHPTASIGRDVDLVAPVVVGAEAVIGRGAHLRQAVVLPGGIVGDGAVVASGTVGDLDGLRSWARSLGTAGAVPATR